MYHTGTTQYLTVSNVAGTVHVQCFELDFRGQKSDGRNDEADRHRRKRHQSAVWARSPPAGGARAHPAHPPKTNEVRLYCLGGSLRELSSRGGSFAAVRQLS